MTGSDRFRALLRRPVVVAPMAGGPSTPALVVAAGEAGALAFLAAGYKTAEAMVDEVRAVRAATPAPFGVNVFVPGVPAADPSAVSAYVASLAGDADAVGAMPGKPRWDDDHWEAKIDALLADPPPVVSFTFGCPPRRTVQALAEAGSVVVVTVTAASEAAAAAAAGADGLCVQGPEAGAHRGTFTPVGDPASGNDLATLLRQVARAADLPTIAAGGIADAVGVAAALRAGALAAQCGTAFLRCPESGASALHKQALADPRFTATAVTRSFSGRPARGLLNRFMRDHADAPAAYPEVNNATRPLRAAAAVKGDLERMSLWAGTGFRQAADLPASAVVDLLSP